MPCGGCARRCVITLCPPEKASLNTARQYVTENVTGREHWHRERERNKRTFEHITTMHLVIISYRPHAKTLILTVACGAYVADGGRRWPTVSDGIRSNPTPNFCILRMHLLHWLFPSKRGFALAPFLKERSFVSEVCTWTHNGPAHSIYLASIFLPSAEPSKTAET